MSETWDSFIIPCPVLGTAVKSYGFLYLIFTVQRYGLLYSLVSTIQGTVYSIINIKFSTLYNDTLIFVSFESNLNVSIIFSKWISP